MISLGDAVNVEEWSAFPTSDRTQQQAFRATLVACFINGWLGSDAVMSRNLESGLSCMESPRTGEEESAGDALALLQLGAQSGDTYVTLEARQKYAAAIARTHGDMDSSADLSSRLATRSMLLLCNVYSQISTGHGLFAGTLHQISLIMEAIANQGPPPNSVRLFIQQYRHCTLLQSLVTGRRVASEHVWQLCSDTAPQDSGEQVIRLALRLPGLIEATEAAVTLTTELLDGKSLSELRSRLLQIELDLVSYLQRQASFDAAQGTNSCQNEFDVSHPDHLSTTTPENVLFTSLHSASCRVLCWICLLLVRQTLIQLPDLQSGSQEKAQLAERANESASLIYGSLQYLWNQGGGLVNKACGVRAPVYFLIKWFGQRQNLERLQRCQRLEAQFRREAAFLDWEGLLPYSLSTIYLLA